MALEGAVGTLVLMAATGAGFVPIKGLDMNTEGSSLIGNPKFSKSRWKEAALMRVIRSLLPLYGVSKEPKPVSWQPAK